MTSPSRKKSIRCRKRLGDGGLTLIEVLIYSALLSFLLAGFIRFAADLNVSDLKLLDSINDAYANE